MKLSALWVEDILELICVHFAEQAYLEIPWTTFAKNFKQFVTPSFEKSSLNLGTRDFKLCTFKPIWFLNSTGKKDQRVLW